MINVALVDDQQLIRQGIASLLSLSEYITVLWQAEDGEQALTMLKEQQPDVLLLDIRMPKMTGIELVNILRGQSNNIPILMLTTFDDSELFMQSLQAGANGFLLKDVSLEKLVNGIEVLAEGGFIAEPVVMKQLNRQLGDQLDHQKGNHGYNTAPTLGKLSEKEQQILKLIAGGFSNKEIAKSIFLADGTVKNHVSTILAKLNTRDRTRAVLIALNHGLI
ncbi:MAG: response regulator transcription factor [Colwellia sp.]